MGDPIAIELEILASPDRMIEECYRLISFPAGSAPQWERFRLLFSPKAVLALRVFPEDDSVTIMAMDEYMVHQMRAGMMEHGYTETILDRRWSFFGDIAEARVEFEMRFGESPPVRAFDLFQLVRREGRWWIVSIISDMENVMPRQSPE